MKPVGIQKQRRKTEHLHFVMQLHVQQLSTFESIKKGHSLVNHLSFQTSDFTFPILINLILLTPPMCGIAPNFRCATPPTFVDKSQKFLWLECCIMLPPLLLMVARLSCTGKMSSVKYIFFSAIT